MNRLKSIISELHPECRLTGDELLVDDGILDSLDIVTLVTEINEKYGISIAAEDIIKENFNTLKTIATLIERRGGKIVCS